VEGNWNLEEQEDIKKVERRPEKLMCSRAKQLEIAVFVYSLARGSRPNYSL